MDNYNKLYISEEANLSIDFEGFEAPFDLILELLAKNNMTIDDLKIAPITDQYIQRIQAMPDIDMDEATVFLDMASRLLEMKSKKLLPNEDLIEEADEMDDETRLKLQLKEYELFKEAGGNLRELENVNRFYKQPDKSVGDARVVFNQFNLEKLLDAFAFILMKTKDREAPPEKKINKDRWTVADKIAFLTNVLKDHAQINFFSLFDDTYSKLEVITVFMAILELLKFQKIEVVQADKYADILIKRKEITDEV